MLSRVVLVVLALVGYAHSHMRWVCPRPESGNSGLKEGICSPEANPFELRYTDITPGPLTLQFEETVVHTTSPMRVTLNQYGKDEGCMLLDHIPHNERAIMDISETCWPFDWPIGKCKAQQFVTVMIPDIECDQCYLQLVSVMTDKYVEEELPCWQINQAQNNCSSYFSCANVKIRPTKEGVGKDIDTCFDYNSNLRGVWPYRPQDEYQVIVNGGESGSANYDSHDQSLTARIAASLVSNVANMMAKLVDTSGQDIATGDVTQEADDFIAIFAGLSKQNVEDMAKNEYAVVLMDMSDRSVLVSGALTITNRRYEMDYYGYHPLDFTDMGWMQGPEFVGAEAMYPFALESHGPCAPPTMYYAGSFTSETSAGIVQVTLSENHGQVRGAFTGTNGLSAITFFSRNGQVSSLSVPSKLISGSHVDAMLDFSDAVDSGSFYDAVTVTLGNGMEMTFDIQAALVASLEDRSEQYGGSAMGIISAGGDITYTVVVSDVDQVTSISVNGFARPGMVGLELLRSSFIATNDGAFTTGSARVTATFMDLLYDNLAYIDVQTVNTDPENRAIAGQISIPAEALCDGDGDQDNTCFKAELSVDGGFVDRSNPELLSYGMATFMYATDGSLQYLLTVKETLPNESVQSVHLTGPGEMDIQLDVNFFPSPLEDKILGASDTVASPSALLENNLANGDVTVKIETSRNGGQVIYGQLPAIRRM